MLHNIEKYREKINNILTKLYANPQAELEFRLGCMKDGKFESGILPGDLKRKLEDKKFVFVQTNYTTHIFDNGIRLRDRTAQKKTQIDRVDLDYAPIAMRLNLAKEETTVIPPNSTPSHTREIERYTTYLNDNVELAISLINNSKWEVEIEYTKVPKTVDDILTPLNDILSILCPGRPNIMSLSDVDAILQGYHRMFDKFPLVGLLRKIGYRPINFVQSDIELIKHGNYAVSNKLDGAKYTLVSHDNYVYAVSDTDAMYLGNGKTTEYFDGEWDHVDEKLYLFDMISLGNENYSTRLKMVSTVVDDLKLECVACKYVTDSTKKIVQWMKSTYKEDWQNRNDGIIYTPIDTSYQASKDRKDRTLKYKFPNKISIDVRLQLEKSSKHEKVFTAVDSEGTKIKGIHITVTSDDDYFEELTDGIIAEVGKQDKVYYVMRLRPDKVAPNYITVILSTLDDMNNPLKLDDLLISLDNLKSVKGGDSNSTSDVVRFTDGEKAKKYIDKDRTYFKPVYDAILEYAKANSLKLSNPECIISNSIPNQIILYTSNGLKSANDLANILYELTPSIFMKTVIPYEEFDVSVLNRNVVKFINYPQVKGSRTDKLFSSLPIEVDKFKLDAIEPEIELIEIYHKLYMPFPEKWEETQVIEEKLIAMLKTLHHGGDKHEIGEKNKLLNSIRDALSNALEFNELGILIGHWAYKELMDSKEKVTEKIQLITDIDNDVMLEKLQNILRDVTQLQLSYKTEEVYIPQDMNIRRTTFYFNFKGAKTPFIDTFNSTTYEIVPWIFKRVKIGNPAVLSRFFLIDRWILMILKQVGAMPAEIANKKAKVLINKVLKLKEKNDLNFGDEYDGIYKDFAIERRRLLKQEEKFRPYKPLDYFQRFGVVRHIDG